MKVFLAFLSLLWIALGVMLILYTEGVRRTFRGLFAKANIRLLAGAPLAIGLLLILASFSQGPMFPLIFILGLLAVIKGLYLLLGPPSQIQRLLEWWFDRAGETTIRMWGIITLVLGIAVFSYILRI